MEYMWSRNDRKSEAALERLTEMVHQCRSNGFRDIPVCRIYASARNWAKGGSGFRLHPERVTPLADYQNQNKWPVETILEWLSDVPLMTRRYGLVSRPGSPGAREIVKNLCAELCRRQREGLLRPIAA